MEDCLSPLAQVIYRFIGCVRELNGDSLSSARRVIFPRLGRNLLCVYHSVVGGNFLSDGYVGSPWENF